MSFKIIIHENAKSLANVNNSTYGNVGDGWQNASGLPHGPELELELAKLNSESRDGPNTGCDRVNRLSHQLTMR